ncbi:MAG: DUF2007 domain-containing protein [Nocardioidaceae bacterium]|nr:DUF2007 domain-containing protein [Nocardioidaceae bacterium]
MASTGMVEVARSNDPVLISFIQALLQDEGIDAVVADQNMAVIEGTIAVWRRRVLVAADHEDRARGVLTDAELDAHLS